MKKIGTVLAFFAMLAFASPVWACGGQKSKSKSTTAKKDQEQTAEKKAESSDESQEDESGEPTKS